MYVKTMSAHGSHLGWMLWSPDTTSKVYYSRTIHTMPRFSHIYCQIFRIRTHGWRKWRTTTLTSTIGSETFQTFICGIIFRKFLTLSLKLMQGYVTSVIRVSLCEKIGNKYLKILKFWRTERSYAQNKNRDKKMPLLGMDTCPSLNDVMEIRCNACTRSEQGYDF
jgi:hypothetical protein